MRGARLNQTGAGHIVTILVIVFLGVVGFAGYRLANQTADTAKSTHSISEKTMPEKINSADDLDTTTKALEGYESQVDSNLNDDALSSDLDDLL